MDSILHITQLCQGFGVVLECMFLLFFVEIFWYLHGAIYVPYTVQVQ